MAKRAKKIELYGKAGAICSLVAIVTVIVILIFMLHRWNFQENMILVGPRSKPFILLGLASAAFLGFLGFLGGLEGAAEGEGKIKTFGWFGFWAGVISAMGGVILAMCCWFYSI